jgi:hypothetical protein
MRGFIDYENEHDGVLRHAVEKADLDTLAAHCKALQSVGATKNTQGDWHVMSADAFTIQAWCDRAGVTWAQFFRDKTLQNRFINDPDNSAFRVHTGRI